MTHESARPVDGDSLKWANQRERQLPAILLPVGLVPYPVGRERGQGATEKSANWRRLENPWDPRGERGFSDNFTVTLELGLFRATLKVALLHRSFTAYKYANLHVKRRAVLTE